MLEVDRVVRMSLRLAIAARENLADAIRETDQRDPDFAVILYDVWASGLFSVQEIGELVGLSRSRAYELVNEGARASRERER